jgi:transposase-like protein
MSILNKSYFHNEPAAFAKLESILWPDGPVCPHCGNIGKVYALEGVRSKPTKKNPEGVVRHGLKKCGACRKQFTVRVGTIFEDSHAPLHKWFQAIHLLCSSKKGISSHQLHRILEVQYKTAWFISHRIREAMRKGSLFPMGGAGDIVEVDETVIGKRDAIPHKQASRTRDRNIVLTLVDRSGEARSFHIDQANGETIVPIVRANVDAEARLMTDQAAYYGGLDVGFAGRGTVDHSKQEYARGEVTTNTVEGFFSVFKRGMKGVYQHCSEKHLHRYLAEFDFRYSNRSALGVEDQERATKAVVGAKGKRLTYRSANRTG